MRIQGSAKVSCFFTMETKHQTVHVQIAGVFSFYKWFDSCQSNAMKDFFYHNKCYLFRVKITTTAIFRLDSHRDPVDTVAALVKRRNFSVCQAPQNRPQSALDGRDMWATCFRQFNRTRQEHAAAFTNAFPRLFVLFYSCTLTLLLPSLSRLFLASSPGTTLQR